MKRGAGYLLAATILVAPVASRAEKVDGVYISLGAGVNFLQDQRLLSMELAGTQTSRFTGQAKFDPGFVGVTSIGWGFGNGLRAELEGSYRYNAVKRLPGAVTSGGHEQKYGVMVNLLYDFDLGWPVMPYVGVGVGEQTTEWRNGSLTAPDTFIRLQHPDFQLAYQGILGASFPLPIPGLSLTAEYRFLAQPTRHVVFGQYFAPGVAKGAEARFADDYNHSLLLGLRYAFNVAPPAVAAMAAPAPVREPARTYLVFFDWDRADLSDRARQVIAEAAQASTRVQVTRIEVNGYTDRSGTAQYNQGLSLRRAQAVAAELVRLGVAREAITIQGFGETRPLVPTPDGVREPQNRRVEIILR
ncbi:MAG TPA: OmpA family protein [Acetobacteraceae bacterium]|nr:OmpA family protein [Acetobacteraceae bacterium]